jgi:hypothetical protein
LTRSIQESLTFFFLASSTAERTIFWRAMKAMTAS